MGQFLLLMSTTKIFFWKHYKCLRFSWKTTIFSILLPIILPCISIYIFNKGARSVTVFPEVDEAEINQKFSSNERDLIVYAPNSTFNYELMESVRKRLQILEERVISFENENDMEQFLLTHKNNRDYGIIFSKGSTAADEKGIPYNLNYTILTRSNSFRTDEVYLNDLYATKKKFTDEYIDSGFLALQQCLDLTYYQLVTERSSDDLEIIYEKFPLNARYTAFMPTKYMVIVMLITYIVTILYMIIIPMVGEKEIGVKEFLRIASSYSYLNNLTFFLTNLAIGMLIFGVILIFGNHFEMFEHLEIIYLIILMMLFIVATIGYSFLISVIFNSIFYAKFGAAIVYVLPYIILALNEDKYYYITPYYSIALLLNGVDVFDNFGQRGLVFTGANLNDVVKGYLYSMNTTYLYFLMDIFIYFTLYFYLSEIFPGSYGNPRPFYFPLMPSYYCKSRGTSTIQDLDVENGVSSNLTSEHVAVKIRGLTKVFKSLFGPNVTSVDNLSLDIEKNRITVLLGHNGAGKTTTMSLICGILPKTSGIICVDGETNIDFYRHKIGYCPQHNIFMPYFTCKDHLLFFGCLRGLSKDESAEQARSLLVKLNLIDKADEYGINLSGGMKRRLCLGNAIIGNTQIAILDEPSSGLDPESRRELWTILLEMRKNHSILLTTHYMEEAETLADKITIIANGKYLCHGTSMELKRTYSVGYILKLLTNDSFQKSDTIKFIQNFVENATIKSIIKPTVNVTLPYKDIDKYSDLLSSLEKNALSLGILSISITDSSLEEVFLNCDPDVNSTNDALTDEVDYSQAYSHLESENDQDLENNHDRLITYNKFATKRQQIFAIFYKKFIYLRVHYLYWLILFSLPIICIILSFYVTNESIPDDIKSEPLKLNMNHIENSEILLYVEASDMHNYRLFKDVWNETSIKNDEVLNMEIINYNDVEDALLKIENNNLSYYHNQLIGAIVVQQVSNTKTKFKIMFSSNAFHSSSIALNFLSNVLLQQQSTDQKYEINIANAPLNKHVPSYVNYQLMMLLTGIIPTAMFFCMLFYVLLPFNEELTEFKKLQGISPVLYWTATFVFDAVLHLILCGILFVVYIICDKHHIFDAKDYTLFASVSLFYGLAYLSLLYLASQLYSSLSTLYSNLTYMFLIMSMAATFLSLTEKHIEDHSGWIAFLLIFPDFAIKYIFNFLSLTINRANLANLHFDISLTQIEEFFGTDGPPSNGLGVSAYFYYMLAVSVSILVFIIYVWEDIYLKEKFVNILCSVFRKCKSNAITSQSSPPLTHDVVNESNLTEQLISNFNETNIEAYPIVVSKLSKKYGNAEVVKDVSFTIKKGECFGLLGINGAGKTTTFKMLTRETTITKGDIFLNGQNSFRNPNEFKSKFGYCPQADALNLFMTAYETLKYIALIRGVPYPRIDEEVKKLLRKTDLEKYCDVKVKLYSGGTKRKLSTAIAMMSDPYLVFLDEPTTGVDPRSRRFMWSCIQECQKKKKNIVLTSHSMDECEFLCNRLAIMANGQLKCIGAIQYLKGQFGLGFCIIIMLKPNQQLDSENVFKIKVMMQDKFQCQLKEEYAGKISYIVTEKNYQWSNVFRQILEIKNIFSEIIDDISVCETSIEDIFLRFANDANAHELREETESL